MYCTNCGKQIPDDSKFCEYCGKPVLPSYDEKPERQQSIHNSTEPIPVISKNGKETWSSLFVLPAVQDQSRVQVIKAVLLASIAVCLFITIAKVVKHFVNHTAGNSGSVIVISETAESSALFKLGSRATNLSTPSSTSASTPTSNGYYILPNTSTAYIFDSDLDSLKVDQITLSCNEIFAINGLEFHDEIKQNYFSSTL